LLIAVVPGDGSEVPCPGQRGQKEGNKTSGNPSWHVYSPFRA
jgi:hypothetical protein